MAETQIRLKPKHDRIPVVAIVGRPNVGKSTFFNRLISARKSIVHNLPGVTRDRIFGMASWTGADFAIIDTGGFYPEATEGLWAEMKAQVELAIEEADSVILIMDGREGLTSTDENVIQYLRENCTKPLFHVVNKIDSERANDDILDFYSAGVDKLWGISAEHGRGISDLLDKLVEGMPKTPSIKDDDIDEFEGEGDIEAQPEVEKVPRVAIVGRPNVGKSTLINQILGKRRLITDNVPGTTRDSVDIEIEIEGRNYIFVDTAGMRRKSKVVETIEKFSIIKALKAVERCDIAVLVLDATQEAATDQDSRVAAWVQERGKATVIVINKWDAIEKDHKTAEKHEKTAREKLKHISYAEVVTISALSGMRVKRLIERINIALEEHSRRIPTAELNKSLALAWEKHPPPTSGKARNKLFYATQYSSEPPSFTIFVSRPKDINDTYKRYLTNFLRETYGFTGTPIRVFLKERNRRKFQKY